VKASARKRRRAEGERQRVEAGRLADAERRLGSTSSSWRHSEPRITDNGKHCHHIPQCVGVDPVDNRDPFGCCHCGTRIEERARALATSIGLDVVRR
jgi:hypothetical protein